MCAPRWRHEFVLWMGHVWQGPPQGDERWGLRQNGLRASGWRWRNTPGLRQKNVCRGSQRAPRRRNKGAKSRPPLPCTLQACALQAACRNHAHCKRICCGWPRGEACGKWACAKWSCDSWGVEALRGRGTTRSGRALARFTPATARVMRQKTRCRPGAMRRS